MSAEQQPTSPELPTRGRFCDVVMKGGVTSGVVYPPIIYALALKYDIKGIGGTSVGAIAASLAAAAEYRRRETQSDAGYQMLGKLPQFLTQKHAMVKLFAADRFKAAALLRTALCLVGSSPFRFLKAIATGVVSYAALMLPIGLLVYVALESAFWPVQTHSLGGVGQFIVHDVMPGVIGVSIMLATLLCAFFGHCVLVLAYNDFGWCHAFDRRAAAEFEKTLEDLRDKGLDITALKPQDTPRLFDWLDAFIAQVAGRDRSAPLTFGDLSNAKLPDWYNETSESPSIDFKMVTTCLTLGRPFEIPFNKQDVLSLDWTTWKPNAGNLLFLVSDLEKYFPIGVVKHMVLHSKIDPLGRTYPIKGQQEPLRTLPDTDDLPILFGARMSMSFPVLFCALRLFAPDPSEPSTVRPLWFSDGGLSSNFPIHLFDAPLPTWPTFALDLLGGGHVPMCGDDDIFLEYTKRSVAVESQYEFRENALGRVLSFGSAIIDAMRTWQDAVLGGLPGNSSRTIGMRLPLEEGGLNLTMPPAQILDLIGRGKRAGSRILFEFVAPKGETVAWKRQRWIRCTTALDTTCMWIKRFQKGAVTGAPLLDKSYIDMVSEEFKVPATAPFRMPKAPWVKTTTTADVGTFMAEVDAVNIDDAVTNQLQAAALYPPGELRVRAPS